MNLSNQKTAKKLLYLAFIIEISVAALAVFLGYTITMSGFSGGDFSTFLLFSLIALVELTRVPLVLSIYRTNSIAWKIIGTLFLIIIMGLAVETLFFVQLQNNNIRLLTTGTTYVPTYVAWILAVIISIAGSLIAFASEFLRNRSTIIRE
jgi:hypothetical protein